MALEAASGQRAPFDSTSLSEADTTTFNVGGREFQLSPSDIAAIPTLASAVDGTTRLPRTKEGHLFLDRDPKLFDHVLHHVRDSNYDVPDKELRALVAEARFYKLRELWDMLLKRLGVDMDAKLALNVGGRAFETTRRVLAEGPPEGATHAPRRCNLWPSVLARQFGGAQALSYTEEGQVFLDLDPDTFAVILQFLETGRLELPPDFAKLDALWDDCSALGLVDLTTEGLREGGIFRGRKEIRHCWVDQVGRGWVAAFGMRRCDCPTCD